MKLLSEQEHDDIENIRNLASMLVHELDEDTLTWSTHGQYVMNEHNEVCKVISPDGHRYMLASYFALLTPRTVLALVEAYKRAEAAEARVQEMESSLRELEAGVISTQASVEQGRFEVRRLQISSERLLKIGECTSDDEIRELAVDEFNRAEAAETRVRDLEAVTLRLATYVETLESANTDLAGCLERAEAAEARVHELELRLGEFLPVELLP